MSGLVVLTISVAWAQPAGDFPNVAPEADARLREMSSYLADLKQFAFETEEMVDFVLDSGQKVQLSERRSANVRRPDGGVFHVEADTGERRVWYNGRTLTLLHVAENVYGVTDVPDTLEATVDYIAEKLGVVLPLSDLLFEDVHEVLTENVESCLYLGLHRVGPRKCHHLAFSQENLDWQIWIDAGQQPLPRKFIITYKQEPGSPQFIAIFTHWDTEADFPDEIFEFSPPPDSVQIKFMESGQPSED
jgi:hypothetical protein